MLNALHFTTRHLFNSFFAIATFVIANLQFDFTWMLLSLPLAGLAYFISNKFILLYQKSRQSKAYGLTRSEFNHIESQLKLARTQLATLTHQYIRVRSIKSFKLINDMNKLAKRILHIVQANPQKFYAVEDFFYAHLPSAVELTDKYTLLTKEQLGDPAIHLALEDTRSTLKELYGTMELDLQQALASDIEGLKLELDFAKLANEKSKQRLKIGGE